MAERVNLYPIRTSNVMSLSAFGFLADFRPYLESNPRPFTDYINAVFVILRKLKLGDWEITYDRDRGGLRGDGIGLHRNLTGTNDYTKSAQTAPVLIYHKKYRQWNNNVIFNMRNCGTCTFYLDSVPDEIFEEAYMIQYILGKIFPRLFFLNKQPTIVDFSSFILRHPTK